MPDEYVGAVMSDLSGRRGRVLGTEVGRAGDATLVRAEVPAIELIRYAVDLRSMTVGTGTFTRTLRSGTTRCPPHLAEQVRRSTPTAGSTGCSRVERGAGPLDGHGQPRSRAGEVGGQAAASSVAGVGEQLRQHLGAGRRPA